MRMAIPLRSPEPNAHQSQLKRLLYTTDWLRRRSRLISSKQATQVPKTATWLKEKVTTTMRSKRANQETRMRMKRQDQMVLFKPTLKSKILKRMETRIRIIKKRKSLTEQLRSDQSPA